MATETWDTKKNEKLSEAEINLIKSAFRSMDLNGDGKVSVSELCRASKQINMKLSYDEARELLQEVDYNGDGYLDFEEFYNMMRDLIVERKKEEAYLSHVFSTMDCNNDGFITAEELSHSMNVSLQEAEELIKEADKNKDGKINYEEFKEVYKGKHD